jgi:hypothetical protein
VLRINSKNELVHAASYLDEEKGSASTVLSKFSNQGKLLLQATIDSQFTNDLVILMNDGVLICGYRLLDSEEYRVTKAAYSVLSPAFAENFTKQLGITDAPENEFPIQEMAWMPAPAEFLSATRLENDRIILGGRIMLPEKWDGLKLLKSPRRNENLVVILPANGYW